MNNFLFNNVKRLIPKISSTELIALRSGNTSIDRMIFNGKVNMSQYKKAEPAYFSFPQNKVNELLEKYKELYDRIINVGEYQIESN